MTNVKQLVSSHTVHNSKQFTEWLEKSEGGEAVTYYSGVNLGESGISDETKELIDATILAVKGGCILPVQKRTRKLVLNKKKGEYERVEQFDYMAVKIEGST